MTSGKLDMNLRYTLLNFVWSIETQPCYLKVCTAQFSWWMESFLQRCGAKSASIV